MAPMRWDGIDTHVLVTGGSSGIGLHIASQLIHEHGARKVTILSSNENRLLKAKKSILEGHADGDGEGKSGCLHHESADVSDEAAMASAVMRAEKKFGPVAVLVCCAGLAECKTFEDTPMEDFEKLMRVNFMGSVVAAKVVMGSMKKMPRDAAKRIAFVSSQAGQVGIYGYTAYAPSKFALRGFAEALQMEVLPHNIAVSLCFPPDTDTPQFQYESQSKPNVTKAITSASSSTPWRPSTVAGIILDGVRKGLFTVSVGLEGKMLSVATAGFAPANSFVSLAMEVVVMPITRIVTQVLLASWNSIVRKTYDEHGTGSEGPKKNE